jgi:outer membrane protein, heavy metal efflux system
MLRSEKKREIISLLLLFLLIGNWNYSLGQELSTTSISKDEIVRGDQETLPTKAIVEEKNELRSSIVPLNLLVEEALKRNPEIKAMARNFDMMRARVPQSKSLPDPMLELGNFSSLIPLPPFKGQSGDSSSERMIGVSQEIPFPGKRTLRGQVAEASANAEWWNFEQTRLNVVAEVKDAYYDLFYTTKALEVIAKNKKLLEQFAKIAEARYAVGRGIQQDVLKAQVEISKLIDQTTVLEQRRTSAEARINSLLYRELETPIGKTEEVKPKPFDYSLEALNEKAVEVNPSLKSQRRQIERAQYSVQLAKKEFYPDFSVGFTYTNRPGMAEMYGVRVGISLPIYSRQKQQPALEEAVASESLERRRLESSTSVLFFRIKDRYLAATTAQRLVKLYGTTIIPQSSLSLESAIAGYEVGRVDFLTLLDNLVTLLNYELNYYEQISIQQRSIAELEPLVGIELSTNTTSKDVSSMSGGEK